MKRFKGVIAPIITPFKSNGDFYELGMLNLLDFLYEHKVDGVYALGSYGSFPLLSISERKNVAEFVETREVALLLQKTGIEYAQGYLFSKPLPKPLQNSDVTI